MPSLSGFGRRPARRTRRSPKCELRARFGTLAPDQGPPVFQPGGQHVLPQGDRAGAVTRQRPWAQPAIGGLVRFGALRVGRHLALDLQHVRQAAVLQAVAEVRVRAVTRVRDQDGGAQPDQGEFIEHVQCEPPIRLVMLVFGDPACLATVGRLRAVPGLGQEQTPGQRARSGVGSGVNTHADLAVADLAQSAGILPGHPGRGTAVFGEAGVIHHPHLRPHRPHGPPGQAGPDFPDRPGRGRHELLQLLVIDSEALGHGLHRLAAAVQQQPPQIQGALLTLVPPHQRREHFGGEFLQLAEPALFVCEKGRFHSVGRAEAAHDDGQVFAVGAY